MLEPTELLRRLATLVPPPRAHVIRYHGVFGPASKWRSEVVPKLEVTPAACPSARPSESPTSLPGPPEPGPQEPKRTPNLPTARIPWATLLLRTYREDVLACACGGRRTVTAFIDAPELVKKILDHLGLPSTGPPIAPARHSVFAEQGTWQDDVPELQQSLR